MAKPGSFHFGTTPKFCNVLNESGNDVMNNSNLINVIKMNDESIYKKKLRENGNKWNK